MKRDNSLSYKDLRKYVNTIKKLEIQRTFLENTINKMQYDIEHLAIPKDIKKPVRTVQNESSGCSLGMCVFILVVGCIVAAIADTILGRAISGISTIIIFVSIIICIISFFKYIFDKNKRETKNEQDFAERYINYTQQLEIDKIKVAKERNIIKCYKDQIKYLISSYDDTCDILKRMYSYGHIYEKYQYDLVAICMFSEYLDSEMCYTLTGHEGAYNLYEEEKFRQLILYKLDEIIKKLDELSENQHYIYQALKEIERQQNHIITDLNNIAMRQDQIIDNQEKQIRHSAAIEYNTRILRYNSEIAAYYHLR